MNKTILASPKQQIYFQGKANMKPKTISSEVNATLTKLADRADREVTDSGYFKPIQEDFSNPEKTINAGKVTLQISPDEADRLFEVYVHTSSGASNASQLLAIGSKEEIIQYLRQEDSADKITQTVKNCANALRNKDFT